MNKLKKNNSTVWLRILLLLGYGGYGQYLYFSGKINFFVHPDYALLSLFASIILMTLSVILFVRQIRPIRSFDCCAADNSVKFSRLSIFFVLLPLIFAFTTQPRPLSSASAAGRNILMGGENVFSRNANVGAGFVINTEKRTIVDWVRLFHQDPEPDHYEGIKVKVIGFVLKEASLPEGYFMISRYIISCCIADARPIGIVVKYDPRQYQFQSDQWIELKGVFTSEIIQGERQIVIQLDSYQDTSPPANPYAT